MFSAREESTEPSIGRRPSAGDCCSGPANVRSAGLDCLLRHRGELADQDQAPTGVGLGGRGGRRQQAELVHVGLERVEDGRDRGIDLVRASQARQAAHQTEAAWRRVVRGRDRDFRQASGAVLEAALYPLSGFGKCRSSGADCRDVAGRGVAHHGERVGRAQGGGVKARHGELAYVGSRRRL